MNDDDLKRLLRSAARAPRSEAEMPFGLETRVLAGWRESRANPAGALWGSVYRPALWVAGGLMLAGVAFNLSNLDRYRERFGQGETEFSVAGSAFQIALTP